MGSLLSSVGAGRLVACAGMGGCFHQVLFVGGGREDYIPILVFKLIK